MVHGRELWGSAAGTGSGRSDKVNYPPGDRGRTDAAEKEDVDGDGRGSNCFKKRGKSTITSKL